MRSARLTGQLALGLVLNQVGLMAVPAVLPTLSREWHLDATAAGWLAAIFFLGYAAGAGLVGFVADRVDARLLVAGGSLLAALASALLAGLADGFWPALALRLVAGIGLAAVHTPGLKLLAERTTGPTQARASAVYSSAYSVGSGASFVIAGVLAAAFGWRAAFWAGAFGPLLALGGLVSLGPPLPVSRERSGEPPRRRGLRAALANRRVRIWFLCYAGNTWEVFGLRTWFVACLAWAASRPGSGPSLLDPALLSGIATLVSVPASVAVAEAAVRWGRRQAILATALASVAVSVALAASIGGPTLLVILLLVLHNVASYADVGSITGGAVSATDPESRGAALALFALGGFATGFLGPVAVGAVIQAAGGMDDPLAWRLAFPMMGLGSLVVAAAMLRRPRDGAPTAPRAPAPARGKVAA